MTSPILVTGGTRTLGRLVVPRLRAVVRAASRAGAPHLVYISIVGADRLPFGYIRAKLECEQLVADSGLPWTMLRATQFYDLILTGARKLAKLPVIPVP